MNIHMAIDDSDLDPHNFTGLYEISKKQSTQFKSLYDQYDRHCLSLQNHSIAYVVQDLINNCIHISP